MFKSLRKKLGQVLRIMADKISGETEEIERTTYSRFTAEEIDRAWRIAAKKVLCGNNVRY